MSFQWLHVDWGDRSEVQGALGIRLSLHPSTKLSHGLAKCTGRIQKVGGLTGKLRELPP